MKMDFKPSNGFHAEDYKKRKIFQKKFLFLVSIFERNNIILLVEQDICKQTAEECKQCYQPYLFENGQKIVKCGQFLTKKGHFWLKNAIFG